MMALDLESLLRTDDCDTCGALHWRDCICRPDRPRHMPTPEDIERARQARLVRAELPEDLG